MASKEAQTYTNVLMEEHHSMPKKNDNECQPVSIYFHDLLVRSLFFTSTSKIPLQKFQEIQKKVEMDNFFALFEFFSCFFVIIILFLH